MRFHSIIFDSVRFYLILWYSIWFYSILLVYARESRRKCLGLSLPFDSIRFYSILFDSMRFDLILFDSINVSARSAENFLGPICSSRSNLLPTTYYIILYTICAKRTEKFAIYNTINNTIYYIQHYKLYYPREAQRNF